MPAFFLSLTDAAREVGMDVKTFRLRFIRSGLVPLTRLPGGHPRVREVHLRRAIEHASLEPR